MITAPSSAREQQLICFNRARRRRNVLGCAFGVLLVSTPNQGTGVLSYVILQSSAIVVHKRTEHIGNENNIRSSLWSRTTDEGDLPKSYTTSKKKKVSSSTVKKPNKPRSKATNVYNNRGPSNISSKTPRGTAVTQPPMIVNEALNGVENLMEQRRRLQDNSIEKECIHYQTCSGCTVGHKIANTNVIRAAQRYFATERYDGGTTTAATTTTSTIRTSKVGRNVHMDDDEPTTTTYPIVIPTPTTQWRTQAKLAVANKSSSTWSNTGCIFGLYEKGSHIVSPIPECVVHHPSINMAIQLLEQATARTGTVAYSENGRDGDLRYVQLQVERITGHVCLTLVYNAATLKECQPSLSRLVKELTKSKNDNVEHQQNQSNIWHSIWCHCNDSSRNNIFSRSPGRWHRLVGPEFMREPIPVEALTVATTTTITNKMPRTNSASPTAIASAAGWLYFSPLTFRQGNLDGFDILAFNVARAVPSGAKVCELYGGVGVLGLTTLAYHYYHNHEPLQWLRCSDENPANVRCFDRSVESLSVDMTKVDRQSNNRSPRPKYSSHSDKEMTIGELAQMMESGETYTDKAKRGTNKKVSYMVATAAKALTSGQALGANVLIVDPPRKGLEEEILEELCKQYEPNQPYVESATMLSIPDDRVNWVNDVQTLIYVSCGFDALASDCDRLLSSRSAKWTLQSTTGYILFPGSDHVETVAIFQRR